MSELIDHTFRAGWTPSGAAAAPLSARALRWLHDRIGTSEATTPAVPASLLSVPESALADQARAELAEVVGEQHVLTEVGPRLGRAGGLSYSDLMRRRNGSDLAVPDAVVLPADADEVQRVVELCVRHDLALVRRMKKRVLVLDHGRLADDIAPTELAS